MEEHLHVSTSVPSNPAVRFTFLFWSSDLKEEFDGIEVVGNTHTTACTTLLCVFLIVQPEEPWFLQFLGSYLPEAPGA